jgi:hypothetical protein
MRTIRLTISLLHNDGGAVGEQLSSTGSHTGGRKTYIENSVGTGCFRLSIRRITAITHEYQGRKLEPG